MGEGPTMASGDRPIDIDILLEHRAFVRRLARQLVRDPATVDDLEQDTWVAALRNPPRDRTPVRAWLTAVVRKLAWTRRRGELRRTRREHGRELPTAPPGPPELLERAAWSQRLVGVVMRLDEPYRTTILLRYFEGLSGSEIARLQAVPSATVRTRLRRGLERLREALDRESAGGRAAWMAAVLPLALGPAGLPPPASPVSTPGAAWPVPVAATVALIGLATLLFVTRDRDEPYPRRAADRVGASGAEGVRGSDAGTTPAAVEAVARAPEALDVIVLGAGRRIPDARVVLATRAEHPWRWTDAGVWQPRGEARTDLEGEARFDGLDPGYVGVAACAPGFGRGVTVAWLPREFDRAVVIELEPERVRRLRVVRRRGEAPIPGATVELREPNGGPALAAPTPDPTDARGIAALRGVAEADTATFTVHAPGYVASPSRALSVEEELRVALEPRGRSLSWPVEAGAVDPPEPGAVLELRRPEQAAGSPSYGEARLESTRIEARDLPAGVLPELLAVAPDGSIARLVVEPGASEGVATRFERPVRLAVTLREEGGSPVCGVDLLLVPEGTDTPLCGATRTDADGHAVLPVEVREPVELQLREECAERARAVARFDPTAGDAQLTVVLPDSRLVVLHVTTPAGPGLDAPFELLCGRRRVPHGVIADSRDVPWRLRVRPERHGEPVVLSLLARGYVPAGLRVDAAESGTLVAQLALQPAAQLVVPLLLRRADQPLRLVLEALPGDMAAEGEFRRGPWPFRLYPGPDRMVREAMIPTGRYCVRDLASGIATPPLELRAGETLRAPLLDLSAPAGETVERIRGWVEAYGDIDLSRARVALDDPEGATVRRCEVARDGSFVLAWPGPGTWTLRLEHPDLEDPRLPRTTLREPREDLVLQLTPWNRAFVRLVPRPAPEPDGSTSPRVLVGREDGTLLELNAVVHGDELHFAGHREGIARLELDLPGYRPVELPARRLVEGTTDLGTVTLERGTSVHLEILAPPDALPPALTISAQALSDPRYQRSTRTGGEPAATLTGLGAGTFQLTAWERYSGRQVWSRRIETDGANDLRLTLDLR